MITIKIPKQCVLELIKENTCTFYERYLYTDITIDIVWNSYSEFRETDNKLILTFEDLSILLFDRVVFKQYSFTLVVD